MAERVLCRYFMHGACKKGEACPFSHDWNDQPSTVCTFYQRGVCSFGDKCRYDHVRLSRPHDGPQSNGGPYTGPQGMRPGPVSFSPRGPFPGPPYGPPGVPPNMPPGMMPPSYVGFHGRPGSNGNMPPGGPSIGLSTSAVPYTPGPPAGRAWGTHLPPLGLNSPGERGESGDYNLPATLDSPYESSSGQTSWLWNSENWEFDEGLPEGAFDDEGIPDDEFEDFQREAAEFAVKGAALRQGLAEVSLQTQSNAGEGTSGGSQAAAADQRSRSLSPGAPPGPGYPGPYPPPPTSSHPGPSPRSNLNPHAGAYHSGPPGSGPASKQHAVPNLGPTPAVAAESKSGKAPAWGGSRGLPGAGDSQSQTERDREAEGGMQAESKPSTSEKPEDQPICPYAAAGSCPKGEACDKLHGNTCPSCGKQCLHPFRPQEREEHEKSCERNQRMLDALRKSQEIECGVCLERVLSKPRISERKFGVLSGCDHAFCVACIRGWRGGNHAAGLDIDTVVRACPVCRVQSHFITPSVVWFFSPEEKDEVVKGYKKRLNDIDCRHFDYGKGQCPFGTSCFYKHAYPDGRREDIKLRHLGSADGSTVIQRDIRLSDFLAPALASRR